MTGGKACDAQEQSFAQSGTLYLSLPLAHTLLKIRDHVRRAGIPTYDPTANIIGLHFSDGGLEQLVNEICGLLTTTEMEDTKSLVVAEGREPALADLMSIRPFSSLLAGIHGVWLAELLRDDRLVSHFQPIVQCSSGTEVFGYECLIRGQQENGKLIPPEWLYHAARGLGMLFQLDRSARLKHIQTVKELGLKSHIFINFNPVAIYDAGFCLKSTVNAIDASGLPRDHFVFEVVESDSVADSDRLLEILDFYRHAGFAVALDDVGAGYNSLSLMAKLRPDYIKLDVQLIRDVDRDEYKAQIAAKLLEMAASLGVATVAEGVETEGEWQWTREHGADFCQGFLFAAPAQDPPATVCPGGALTEHVHA